MSELNKQLQNKKRNSVDLELDLIDQTYRWKRVLLGASVLALSMEKIVSRLSH